MLNDKEEHSCALAVTLSINCESCPLPVCVYDRLDDAIQVVLDDIIEALKNVERGLVYSPRKE